MKLLQLSGAWRLPVALAVAGTLAACEPSSPKPESAATPPAAGTEAVAAAPAASAPQQGSASPLASLRAHVGAYPHDGQVNFLEQGALAERLQQLLGKDYPTLLANMRTVGPLTEDQGRWFITGNRPHEGGAEAAAIVVDAAQNAVRVWMLHEGAAREFLDPQGAAVPWPQDVQTLLDNHKSTPKG